MILVIDVGNTNLTIGVYDGEELKATFRMMTKTPRTSDEYGVMLTTLLSTKGITTQMIEGCIVASVVPDVMHSLTGGITRYIGVKALIVGPGLKTGIKIVTENPRAIGADRIVDAVAAYEKYGGPVLVIDFGTATTYDLVTADAILRQVSLHPVSASAPRLCGLRRPSFPRLRSKSQNPYWLRRPSPACRPAWYTGRSDRRNTSSGR